MGAPPSITPITPRAPASSATTSTLVAARPEHGEWFAFVQKSVGAVMSPFDSFLVLRGSDLTRLMVTLGVALVLRELANRYGWLTGGADGLQGVTINPLLGVFRFDMFGHTGYAYCLTVLFILFLIARRLVNSPFGLSLMSVKGNALRASAIGISPF